MIYIKRFFFIGVYSLVYLLFIFFTLLLFLPALIIAIYCRFLSVMMQHNVNGQKKVIFVGFENIANNVVSVTKSLSRLGYQVVSFQSHSIYYPVQNLFAAWSCDKDTSIIKTGRIGNILIRPCLPFIFLYGLYRWDGFFYIWNQSFMSFKLDYVMGSIAKKTIISLHCGDDVRYRPLQRSLDASVQYNSWIEGKRSFRVFIRTLWFQFISESYAKVISHPGQATFQIVDLIYFRFPQPRLIDTPKYSNETPLIIHAPSNPNIKGTTFVKKAFQILRKRGIKFSEEIIENVSNDYVLKRLRDADIAIDQPGAGVAKFAAEAMASGCAVIGGNRNEFFPFPDCPIIQFTRNADNLAYKIESLINDRKHLETMMMKNYRFWEKYYSPESFDLFLSALLTHKKVLTFQPRNNSRAILLENATKMERLLLLLYFFVRSKKNQLIYKINY